MALIRSTMGLHTFVLRQIEESPYWSLRGQVANHLLQSEKGEGSHQSTHLHTALNTQFPLSVLCIPSSFLLRSPRAGLKIRHILLLSIICVCVSMGVFASVEIMNSWGGGRFMVACDGDEMCRLSHRSEGTPHRTPGMAGVMGPKTWLITPIPTVWRQYEVNDGNMREEC